MQLRVGSYIPVQSPVHACDARVKIVLLAAYSVTLFLVDTWAGLGVCALALGAVLGVSRVGVRRVFGSMSVVYMLVALTVVFNAFALDGGQVPIAAPPTLGIPAADAALSASGFGAQPIALAGSFGLVPAGLARGCFFAVRIVLLVAASLIITSSTMSTELTDALGSFLSPLRPLHVPVDDIAMVFGLALRFIPVTAEELGRVHDAQLARGASFDDGGLWARLSAWQTVMIPLFVGLFRRADSLAVAMDARCYGAPDVRRTSLGGRRLTARGIAALAVGLAICASLAVLL